MFYEIRLRSSRPEVFCNKRRSKIFRKINTKTLLPKSFFNKVCRSQGLQLYQKRGSGTGAFLWILQNFLEQLLLPNTSGGCFWRLMIKVMHLQWELSLEYYGHAYFVPTHHNLILWETCYTCPVLANHLSYDTVLLPPTGMAY